MVLQNRVKKTEPTFLRCINFFAISSFPYSQQADQLSKLFKCLPAVIDPADMNNVTATWG